MSVTVLSPSEIQAKLQERNYSAQKTYLAMYSTWWGGIVKDPGMMVVPVDDHLVHRGDGVFEAIKVIEGKAFLLQEHLERLEISAGLIGLPMPMPLDEVKKIIMATTQATGAQNAMLRLYISRGPGGFTTNPYDSIASQLYLVVTSYAPIAAEKYQQGVKVGRSQVPPKEPWLAKIKTCNYLPNVLMKKESVDRKIDFTIGVCGNGFLTEGSTENIVLIDKNKNLIRPHLRHILKGTTMMRSFELAQSLVKEGHLNSVIEKDLTESDILNAQEVMMIGTTLDVLPVTEYEGKVIGSGKQGPIAEKMLKLLRADMKEGPKATPVYHADAVVV
ncbi:aminotransferase class IV [Bdellovibrio reynosensis]|uniref:Aminotransferase class IV n=1 Tax=Bdellovibrio reynosensis TaxID=2835041 RepID=A0ABY4CBI6_9BACT|nr:aminotransferase class IV [Bdellovibrio reynosensis]UOF02208.1 aminotransferase class IV [Bdellovibrio reynosensis]